MNKDFQEESEETGTQHEGNEHAAGNETLQTDNSTEDTDETSSDVHVEELQDNANREDMTTDEENADASSTELEEMKKKYNEVNDKYLRLYSEFENYRKRTAKERLELIGSANADLIRELLCIIDDFERAINVNESSEDLQSVKEGFQLIHDKFSKLLAAKGVKPMDAVGMTFDVENHEAMTNIPAPSEDMKGKVVEVLEKGYYLNDNVLRYAKVIVGQ